MNNLYRLIEKFVVEYLPTEKGYSKNTALSYYSTIKQYLDFYSCKASRKGIGVLDFNRDKVREYLAYIENRGCAVSTRNQKLIAH